jgi:hypothetical protein
MQHERASGVAGRAVKEGLQDFGMFGVAVLHTGVGTVE